MLNSGEELGPISKLLFSIVKEIVDNPNEVEISEKMGDQTLVIFVATAKSDIGKVIGKKGWMAEALRTIMKAMAGKTGSRVVLELES